LLDIVVRLIGFSADRYWRNRDWYNTSSSHWWGPDSSL